MATYLIKTPNKFYSGVTAGVSFVNGEGETTDPIVKNQLEKEFGYEVTEKKEEKPVKAPTKRRSSPKK